jgi:hypothetical protein
MARRDGSQDPDDIDALLAEVDQTLHGRPNDGRPRQRASQKPGGRRGTSGSRVSQASRNALIVGVVALVIVWIMFALLPFVTVGSGSIGAFLAGFGTAFAYNLRRG